MFWRKSRPTIDHDTVEWILECWQWLDEILQPIDAAPQRALIFPSRSEFPDTVLNGQRKAEYYFDLVREKCGMSQWPAELRAQDPARDLGKNIVFGRHVKTSPPLGTFQAKGNAAIITYDPAIVDDPIQLVATFAHELAHYVLRTFPQLPPGGNDLEELATDLATVHLGFGLFGANTAFNFSQETNYDRQGWSTSRSGYLGENGWCFACALFAEILGVDTASYQAYAKPSVASQIKKNRHYISSNPEMVRNCRSA